MKENKEIKNLEKCRKAIEKPIKEKENELKKLKDFDSELWNRIYDIKKMFQCPEGLSNEDALCPECKYALPEITQCDVFNIGEDKKSYVNVTYPPDERSKLTKINIEGRYCVEWKKKVSYDVCGCGGTIRCKCGYLKTYCTMPTGKCPFCGRDIGLPDKPLWDCFYGEQTIKGF